MSLLAKELRQLVGTALTGIVGTYTLSSGATTPAVWVTPPQVSNTRKVTGLEVIVYASPEFNTQGMLYSHSSVTRVYTIRLVQHDPTKTCEDGVEALYKAFPTVVEHTILPATDLGSEQAIVKLTSLPNYLTTNRI